MMLYVVSFVMMLHSMCSTAIGRPTSRTALQDWQALAKLLQQRSMLPTDFG
jgi:hypothetical protein